MAKAINNAFSRTKVQLFMECPCCFYLDQVRNISRPTTFPYTLNIAVDKLLKTSFDLHRQRGEPHPLFRTHGLTLLPFQHPQLNDWRNTKIGLRTSYQGRTFFGVPDDIWVDAAGLLYVADYKATANSTGAVTQLTDKVYHRKYREQLAFYQWLLLRNGFQAADTAYLLYLTGDSARPYFEGQLHFQQHIIAVEVDNTWVEPVLDALLACLASSAVPDPSPDCAHCQYVLQRIG